MSDETCSGRPKTSTNEDIFDFLHDMVLDSKLMTMYEIAEAVGISNEGVFYIFYILKNELGFKILLARWVPHSLILDQTSILVRFS